MKVSNILFAVFAIIILTYATGCTYRFTEAGGLDPALKTVRVRFIENRAPYINPQLSPNLTDRIRQKIVNQTKLTQTNNDNAHLDISGYISDYSVSTSGISQQNNQRQSSVNRLTVSVVITVINQLNPEEAPKEVTATRQFDFGANQSLQAAEAQLLDEMVRNLTDEIFNRIFSNW
jgi:outer membrane lipopolysaccharide assembly protein LptE/RlpB